MEFKGQSPLASTWVDYAGALLAVAALALAIAVFWQIIRRPLPNREITIAFVLTLLLPIVGPLICFYRWRGQ